MKKVNASTPRVIGRLDSLTDVLKQLLFQYEPRSLAELLPPARAYLGLRHSPGRLEKDVLRCLQKNPAFEETNPGLWSLNLRGMRENDSAYQVLKKEGRPLRLLEINEYLSRNGRQSILEEKQLVRDGRFLRLKGGQWVLVPWEVTRGVQPKELDQVVAFMRRTGEPPPIGQISEEILGTGWRETNLLQCLEEDHRFVWVGGDRWYLRALVPAPPSAEEDPLAFLRDGELSALQGAELMLTFQDSDPQRRTYIISSRDLQAGIMRISKRLEKLFLNLPPVAFISFKTPAGPCPAWYYREAQLMAGLGPWFAAQGLAPGSKLEIKRVQEGEEVAFHLVPTGEREAEVYEEARRVERIAALREEEELAGWPAERLLAEILRVFPEGLGEETLLRIVGLLRPEVAGSVLPTLAELPFFEEISPGTWYFNEGMKQAYDDLQSQVREARAMLERQRAEVAATMEQARALTVLKRDLEAELEAWQQRAKEAEDRLKEALAQVQALEREKTALRDELEKLVRRKEQLRAELAQAEQEIAGLQAEKEALESRVEQLENRLLQLQGSYNKSLSKAQAEHTALKQKLSDTEKRLQGALVANQELQKLLAQLQEERLDLKRQLSPWPVRLAVAISRLLGFGRSVAVDL
ncbi:MAG: hypothetical protein H5U00_06905 [Clostridia bacterium]|nr:hypothetical protein [Clostridia bacterium]